MRAASTAVIHAGIAFGGAFKTILSLRDFKFAWNNMTDGDLDGNDSVSAGKESIRERRLGILGTKSNGRGPNESSLMGCLLHAPVSAAIHVHSCSLIAACHPPA